MQGPEARERLRTALPVPVEVGRFRVASFDFDGEQCLVAGTGYTGEDGVEFAVPVAVAERFWDAVTAAGISPAGLGARDTLRLEAALPLHGHELGPGHHAARRRPRLGRELDQGRLPRACRSGASAGGRRRPWRCGA